VKICLMNHFSDKMHPQLQSQGYEVVSENQCDLASSEIEAILLRSKNLHNLSLPKGLLAVARAGAGVNNIPVQQMSEQGIAVFNAPGANANAVAEMVLTAILMQVRHVKPVLEFTGRLDSHSENLAQQVESEKSQFQGRELQGLKLGIIGLGAIGVLLANKAVALGMKVFGFDPHISVENAWRLSSEVIHKSSLTALLNDCEALSIHVPYMEATHHLLNQEKLALLPAGSFVLNFSRDEVVDRQAVLSALEKEQLSAYITDFPESALLQHDKVMCFPHLGASTKEAQENASTQVIHSLDAFLKRGEIRYSVNLPELPAGEIPNGCSRLLVIHQNRVGMIAQITDCIEEAEENIIEMNNRSREALAVTLIDLQSDKNQELLSEVERLEAVLSVRYC